VPKSHMANKTKLGIKSHLTKPKKNRAPRATGPKKVLQDSKSHLIKQKNKQGIKSHRTKQKNKQHL
jgi:hypothetical protein